MTTTTTKLPSTCDGRDSSTSFGKTRPSIIESTTTSTTTTTTTTATTTTATTATATGWSGSGASSFGGRNVGVAAQQQQQQQKQQTGEADAGRRSSSRSRSEGVDEKAGGVVGAAQLLSAVVVVGLIATVVPLDVAFFVTIISTSCAITLVWIFLLIQYYSQQPTEEQQNEEDHHQQQLIKLKSCQSSQSTPTSSGVLLQKEKKNSQILLLEQLDNNKCPFVVTSSSATTSTSTRQQHSPPVDERFVLSSLSAAAAAAAAADNDSSSTTTREDFGQVVKTKAESQVENYYFLLLWILCVSDWFSSVIVYFVHSRSHYLFFFLPENIDSNNSNNYYSQNYLNLSLLLDSFVWCVQVFSAYFAPILIQKLYTLQSNFFVQVSTNLCMSSKKNNKNNTNNLIKYHHHHHQRPAILPPNFLVFIYVLLVRRLGVQLFFSSSHFPFSLLIHLTSLAGLALGKALTNYIFRVTTFFYHNKSSSSSSSSCCSNQHHNHPYLHHLHHHHCNASVLSECLKYQQQISILTEDYSENPANLRRRSSENGNGISAAVFLTSGISSVGGGNSGGGGGSSSSGSGSGISRVSKQQTTAANSPPPLPPPPPPPTTTTASPSSSSSSQVLLIPTINLLSDDNSEDKINLDDDDDDDHESTTTSLLLSPASSSSTTTTSSSSTTTLVSPVTLNFKVGDDEEDKAETEIETEQGGEKSGHHHQQQHHHHGVIVRVVSADNLKISQSSDQEEDVQEEGGGGGGHHHRGLVSVVVKGPQEDEEEGQETDGTSSLVISAGGGRGGGSSASDQVLLLDQQEEDHDDDQRRALNAFSLSRCHSAAHITLSPRSIEIEKMRRTSLPAALPAQRHAIHHGSAGIDTALLLEAHGLVTDMLMDQAALPAHIVAGLKALATLLTPPPLPLHYQNPTRPRPAPLTLSTDPDYTSDIDEIPYTGEKIWSMPKRNSGPCKKGGVSANLLRRMSTSTWTTTTSATGMPTLEPQPNHNARRRRSATFRTAMDGTPGSSPTQPYGLMLESAALRVQSMVAAAASASSQSCSPSSTSAHLPNSALQASHKSRSFSTNAIYASSVTADDSSGSGGALPQQTLLLLQQQHQQQQQSGGRVYLDNPDDDNCSTASTLGLGDGPGPPSTIYNFPDNSGSTSSSHRLSPVTFTLQEPIDDQPLSSSNDDDDSRVLHLHGCTFDLLSMASDPLICRLNEWDYPIFDLEQTSSTQILSHVCYKVFLEVGLFETFKIPIREFINYFHALEMGYRDKPYHNRMHAADVLHGVYYLTSQPIPGFEMLMSDPETPCASDAAGHRAWFNVEESSSYGIMGANFPALELMAMYTAAAMHDYDHPGRTNAFLVTTHAPQAILYNDRSVLENHHAAAAWSLLFEKTEDCNFLKYLDKAEFKRFRYLVIEAILATDLKRHFEILAEFNAKVNEEDSPGIDWNLEADRLLVMEMCIKLADINGPCKFHDIHVRWTHRIAEEFYEQGDEEEELGLPISPYMDRKHPQLAKLQESFINHLVAPLCKACAEAGILPGYWEDEDEADEVSSCQETDNENDSSYSDDNSESKKSKRKIICLQTKHLQDNHRYWMNVIKEETRKKEEGTGGGVKTESVAISTEDPMETIEEENNTPHSLNRSFSFEKEDSKL